MQNVSSWEFVPLEQEFKEFDLQKAKIDLLLFSLTYFPGFLS